MSVHNTLTVRQKLTTAFGGLAVLVLLVAGLSMKAVGDANDRFAGFVKGLNASGTLANHVRSAVDRRAIAARNLVLVSKPADIDTEKAAVLKAHEDVKANMAELKKLVASASAADDPSRRLVSEFERIEAAYGPIALAIVDLALAKRNDEAIAKMNDECRPLLAALVKVSSEFAGYIEAREQQMVEDSAAAYAVQRSILLAACVVAFAAAMVAGLLITRSLSRALGAEPTELGEAAQRVAGGDLRVLDGAASAPKGSVLASIGMMQQSLATIVGQVRGASDSIATGSAQIATGNADLSQRTEQQASALQETAASMDELGSTVHQNAESARQANELAIGASAIAVKGGHVVGQMVQTMQGINDSSRRIADIIGVIDGIAFQTNILALNAAVEAARAGEQGRGFAVVASEVRSLAQRSAEAAKEIKGLINASAARVAQGSTLAEQVGSTMNEIVDSIGRVSAIVGEISTASTEQSVGVAQVGEAVTNMDRATQQNAALVEESAAAAESLNAQAQQLVQAVAVFQLVQREGRRMALA